MISENSANNANNANKMSNENFFEQAAYLGFALNSSFAIASAAAQFVDLEVFFLAATYNLKSSRLAEGFFCWLFRYGHLLSPSKLRRLIQGGLFYDPALLGVFMSFMIKNKILSSQLKILKPFCRKKKPEELFFNGPPPRVINPDFKKWGLIAPQFKLEENKYLRPVKYVFQHCLELKNRALFGSVPHADVAAYLHKQPQGTPYQVSKATHHHKARIFEIFQDIADASP